MSDLDDRRRFAALAMRQMHAKDALLVAVLRLGDPNIHTDTWSANRLHDLYQLALRIRDTGSPDLPHEDGEP